MAKTLTKILAPALIISAIAFPSEAGPIRRAKQVANALPEVFEKIISGLFSPFENTPTPSKPSQPRKYTRNEEEELQHERNKYERESEKGYLKHFLEDSEIDNELLSPLKSRQKFEKNSVYEHYKKANQGATSFGKSLLYDIVTGNCISDSPHQSEFQKELNKIRLEKMIPWGVNWENPDNIEKTIIEKLSFYSDNFYERLQTEKAGGDSPTTSKAKDFIRAINMPRIQANQERR